MVARAMAALRVILLGSVVFVGAALARGITYALSHASHGTLHLLAGL